MFLSFWKQLTIFSWFLSYIDRNQPQLSMCPHPEPRLHLPPRPTPLGFPSAPALSALFHPSNLDRSSISHVVTYMFQYYSLISSHPRLLPHSPIVCSLYLCLFCCLTRFVDQKNFLTNPLESQLNQLSFLYSTSWKQTKRKLCYRRHSRVWS